MLLFFSYSLLGVKGKGNILQNHEKNINNQLK